ncbi:MAG TPA: PBSX family phage terminase large subunit [Anaerohalosphaeraceae bacterium]|nr:PBSX family phage terminase large subunit [Anaerohalosphaeraceae bacterium]HQG06803.1 PBSX family phage terminase large subunit [Anaerohalosphaeraceae bacterium]HQI08482.1 PBSX family phage terminase large subunit [Anaerohalosphaeraceae bacterium]HQJ68898.1 PBSX family phage terminase large subunit [Anaerohalosphaeraceae bacterium]
MIKIDASAAIHHVNKAFLPIFKNTDRYLILYGGAGSGKSVAAAQKCILRLLYGIQKNRSHRILILRKTMPAVRKSTYEEVKNWLHRWNLWQICEENKTQMGIELPYRNELIFMGLDNPEKLKSIHGITSVWMEEATEFTQEDFLQVDLRLRGKTWDYKQIILTFNPVNIHSWIYKHFFLELEEQGRIIETWNRVERSIHSRQYKQQCFATIMRSTSKDNQFIDDDYRARLEMLKSEDANYYQIYALGLWGQIEGLVFTNWKITPDFPEMDEGKERIFGLDFGYAANPTAIVEVVIRNDSLYLREHLYRPHLQNRQIADICLSIQRKHRNCLFVADSAEPKSIDEIRSYGVNCVPAIKGPDSVLYGIQRMKQYQIFIEEGSVNLIKEFQSYKWATAADGSPKEIPVKFCDHAIDAARYALTKIFGKPVRATFIPFAKKIENDS